MKEVVVKLVRLRNPRFDLDPDVDNRMLISFFLTTAWAYLRGWRLCLFGKRPRGLLLGRGVSFQYLHKVRFGAYLKLGNYVSIKALGKEGVCIGDNVSIGACSKLVVSTTMNDLGSYIKLGDNVGIGEYAYLGGSGGLTIGNDCIIGQYFSCHPENHNFKNADVLIRHQGVRRQGIFIGQNCWIGSKVSILDGVSIGDNCVIAAGAVLTQSFPSNSLIGGVPARLISSTVGKAI